MPRYWLMTPAADWEDWKKDGIISSKWITLKNYLEYSKEDLEKELKTRYIKYYDRAKQIIEFSKSMQIGDFILLKKGNYIIAYGQVTSDYIYNPERQRKHIRKVHWISIDSWKINEELPHKDLKDITNEPILKTIKEIVFRES